MPKLQTAHGERSKRYLYVAIDRRSRSVHLAVKDDETTKSAIAFLREAAAAFPCRLTHVLTGNGSCFTPACTKTCAELGAEYRHTRPYSPQTNGMVERFNGRVGSEVLGITIYSHRDLEQLLRGFNAAYNTRRQRVLDGKAPDQVVAERLKTRRKLASAKPHGRAGPGDIARARQIASRQGGLTTRYCCLLLALWESPASGPGISHYWVEDTKEVNLALGCQVLADAAEAVLRG